MCTALFTKTAGRDLSSLEVREQGRATGSVVCAGRKRGALGCRAGAASVYTTSPVQSPGDAPEREPRREGGAGWQLCLEDTGKGPRFKHSHDMRGKRPPAAQGEGPGAVAV